MRKLIVLLLLFFNTRTFSQVYEAGISYNLGNVIGESNALFPISTSNKNWGVVLKKNMNPRISYRLGINLIESGITQLAELSGGIDFNFTDYNLIRTRSTNKQAPYLVFELATLFYNTRSATKFAVALPIGIGYKYAITKKITSSIEAKYRTVFTDNLDNIKTNKSTLDTYYYLGASIYYTFGWPKGSKNQIRF